MCVCRCARVCVCVCACMCWICAYVHVCAVPEYVHVYSCTGSITSAFPSPPTHIPDVVHIWVVFWWREEQLDPGYQLHAAEGGVGKVEEDTKHYSYRDELQNRSSKGRQD